MASRYEGGLCTVQTNKNVVFCICQPKAPNSGKSAVVGENKNNYVLEVVQNYLMNLEDSCVSRAFVFQDGRTSAVDFDQSDSHKIYYARYNEKQDTSLHHVLTMSMALLERKYKQDRNAENYICIVTSCDFFGAQREKIERNCLYIERKKRWCDLPFKLIVFSNAPLSSRDQDFLKGFQEDENIVTKQVSELECDLEGTLADLFA